MFIEVNSMRLTRLDDPAPLLTAAEIREYHRLSTNNPVDTDQFLDALGVAATQAAEGYTGRIFVATQLQVDYRDWPAAPWRIPGGKIEAFDNDAVRYLTAEKLDELRDAGRSGPLIETGDMEVATVDQYVASVGTYGYTLRLVDSELNSAILARVDSAVRVTYTAGWTDAASVPDILRIATQELVGDLYENREAQAMSQIYENAAVKRMLDTMRVDPIMVYAP